tara:strand:- start:2 stop:1702 length:1701 start_codon:yes stop_codon:yes gene_type:complete
MQMTEADINRLNQMRLSESFDPSMLLSDTPYSKIEPIGGLGGISQREAFGGPLYQMMNPSGRSIVDALGSRGQGISGFATEMAFGPAKAKAVVKGIASLPMSEKIMDKAFSFDKSKVPPQEVVDTLMNKHRNIVDSINSYKREGFFPNAKTAAEEGMDKLFEQKDAIEEMLKKYALFDISSETEHIKDIVPLYTGAAGVINAKLQKVIENSSFFDPKARIGKQNLIEKAQETSPASAKIIEEVGDYIDSPGADFMGDPYFIRKFMESGSVKKGLKQYDDQARKGQYAKGKTGGEKYVSDIGEFPNASTRFYNKAETTSINMPMTSTAKIGTEAKPFFVDPKKLAEKLTMSSSGADFFKVRGAGITKDGQYEDLTQSILTRGYLNRPIDIEITPMGYAHLSEGNHRLAKALTEGYKEIPVQFRYSIGAERVNHDFAINKLDQFLAPGSKGFKTKKEFDDFAEGIYNQAMTKENEALARGLIQTDKIGKPAFRNTDELQEQLDFARGLYKKQNERFQRAYKVQQSARRDGYLPDIDGSEKIMKNANEYGKQIKAEIDALEDMISNANT